MADAFKCDACKKLVEGWSIVIGVNPKIMSLSSYTNKTETYYLSTTHKIEICDICYAKVKRLLKIK